MKETECKREKARVAAVLRRWKKLLVHNWDVTYSFSETIDDSQEGFQTAMQCRATWPYRKASVAVALEATATMDDERLENAVIHELLHAVVNQMRECVPSSCLNCGSNRTLSDGAMKHEEAVVQNIADIIHGLVR